MPVGHFGADLVIIFIDYFGELNFRLLSVLGKVKNVSSEH